MTGNTLIYCSTCNIYVDNCLVWFVFFFNHVPHFHFTYYLVRADWLYELTACSRYAYNPRAPITQYCSKGEGGEGSGVGRRDRGSDKAMTETTWKLEGKGEKSQNNGGKEARKNSWKAGGGVAGRPESVSARHLSELWAQCAVTCHCLRGAAAMQFSYGYFLMLLFTQTDKD